MTTAQRKKRLTMPERVRLRYRLYWKYGPECMYCHKIFGDWRHLLTIDHIQPIAHGGSIRDISNLVLACEECNKKKGSTR